MFFLQVSCTRDDLLLLFYLPKMLVFFDVYFLFYIKYLKLFTLEKNILIFHFYKTL
jgi:hypothetical protein